jgi:hypothetical protein
MRFACHTVCVLMGLVIFQACSKPDHYKEKAKTLDSLSTVVHSIINGFGKTDTISLQKSVTRFMWYKQFVEQNIKDTISKDDADNLQHFYASGKDLESFTENRIAILARAHLIKSQLYKLQEDVKSKSLNEEQLIRYTLEEQLEVEKLAEISDQRQKDFYSSLEKFKSSLKGIEILIRSRNNGELPTIIKDTIDL